MKTIAATLKIRGGKEGGQGTTCTMGKIGDTKNVTGSDVVCIEGNGSRPSHKGNGWSLGGAMYTLNSTEVHAVCYAIGAYDSNAWKSRNPHSGVCETETSKTLDAINCGYPGCNQGGVAVVEIRESGISSDGQQD